ncbi:MAG: metallophosphoesterase [Deltaproteobacteria bacterium]|nr:metallophosphoesterase [Deltaproteobacteria bacterium]
MTRISCLLLLLLLPACNAGFVTPVDDDDVVVPDDDDVADDDDSTAASNDDDSTAANDDDSTVADDDDSTANDDDSTVADDDDSTIADDDDDGTPAPTPVRWVALGDTGEGNTDQALVADAIETVCAAQGCDFALLLGDNFYDVGVEDVNDSLWETHFETPYQNLQMPFYPTLGNHDGGAGGTGLDVFAGNVQVAYTTSTTTNWTMPDRYYAHAHANAEFFSLDTSLMFFDGFPIITNLVDDQETWITSALAGSTAEWKIAYGHHPYLSNGPHGNAGNYEGLPSFTPYAAGTEIKNFMDANVCGEVDLYLCGHDHSRQWNVQTCAGTELMVSGGGAKRTDIEGSNPVYWQDTDDDMEGFIWFEILGNTITVEFWNKNAVLDYSGSWTK